MKWANNPIFARQWLIHWIKFPASKGLCFFCFFSFLRSLGWQVQEKRLLPRVETHFDPPAAIHNLTHRSSERKETFATREQIKLSGLWNKWDLKGNVPSSRLYFAACALPKEFLVSNHFYVLKRHKESSVSLSEKRLCLKQAATCFNKRPRYTKVHFYSLL